MNFDEIAKAAIKDSKIGGYQQQLATFMRLQRFMFKLGLDNKGSYPASRIVDVWLEPIIEYAKRYKR